MHYHMIKSDGVSNSFFSSHQICFRYSNDMFMARILRCVFGCSMENQMHLNGGLKCRFAHSTETITTTTKYIYKHNLKAHSNNNQHNSDQCAIRSKRTERLKRIHFFSETTLNFFVIPFSLPFSLSDQNTLIRSLSRLSVFLRIKRRHILVRFAVSIKFTRELLQMRNTERFQRMKQVLDAKVSSGMCHKYAGFGR